MATHVAIAYRKYIQLILEGRKTVESRLSMSPIAPWQKIAPGDTIYFKVTSQGYLARATVAAVAFYDRLTPQRIRELYKQYNPKVCGEIEYWRRKKFSRYASFIHLSDAVQVTQGPPLKPSQGLAWFVIDEHPFNDKSTAPDKATPAIEITLTPAMLRNHYVRLTPRQLAFETCFHSTKQTPAQRTLTLVLPDQRAVTTDIYLSRFRWRGWGEYFTHHQLQAGDQVIFQAQSPDHWLVSFRHQSPSAPSTSTSPAIHKSAQPRWQDYLTRQALDQLLQQARYEDLGLDDLDLTSELVIAKDALAQANFVNREAGTLAGADLLPQLIEVFSNQDQLQLQLHHHDGDCLPAHTTIATLRGNHRHILKLERTALNLMSHLSGIASLTARFVTQVAGTRAAICDTRKTLPGLRALQKYAVACGGGINHRMGLHDAVLVKDNHLAHLPLSQLTLTVIQLIQQARACKPKPRFVQIEVDTLEQLRAVLQGQPDMVLLDNMNPPLLTKAVELRNQLAPHVILEASGGVNLKTVTHIARTGVDRISIGALTHSVTALDIGLDIEPQ